MSATTDVRSELDALVAARLRGAGPEELLDLADEAIEQASAAADTVGLELIGAELDAAAAAHPETADGLRVAAARARAALPTPAPEPVDTAAPRPAVVEAPTEPGEAEADRRASWGRRLGAWLIDWCVLFAASPPFTYLLGDNAGTTILLTLGFFSYFAYLNGQGRTLGKLIVRIRVVDASTGASIGTGRGIVRELVRLALTIFTLGIGLFLDGLRPLWNETDQSWHDAAARSIVVQR